MARPFHLQVRPHPTGARAVAGTRRADQSRTTPFLLGERCLRHANPGRVGLSRWARWYELAGPGPTDARGPAPTPDRRPGPLLGSSGAPRQEALEMPPWCGIAPPLERLGLAGFVFSDSLFGQLRQLVL